MIFIFMISQVFFWRRTTKILISYCFGQHVWAVGASEKTDSFLLVYFLSWAIFKNHWFSLGFLVFVVHTWSSFSWSLKSFFGHARRKSWFHIVFYSIFGAVGTSEETVFFRLFHFLSWAISKNHWFSLGFPMYFVHTWSSFSWSLKSFLGHARRKYWFHIVFYSIFEPWASPEKTGFLTLFHFLSWAIFKNHCFSLGFPMFFANTWSAFSWSLKSIFGQAQRKYWFHIVFYSIFEPWAPPEKVSFLDFFTFSRERFLKNISFP